MTEQLITRFIAARRKYIASQFKSLNSKQLKAVLTTEGPLLLLAGAGSGKTTVLINRIANIIRYGRGSDCDEMPDTIAEDDISFLEHFPENATDIDTRRADNLCAVEPVPAYRILAITFTNKAANQLKERLGSMLGDAGQDVWAMTFHSACCRILRREIEHLGYTKSFTIYDDADSERLMKQIIRDMGLDDKTFPAKYVLNIISRQKDNMIGPDEMREQLEIAENYGMMHIAKAYKIYQTRLKENNALDFDDIIFKTVELLQNFEDVRLYYQRRFHYVLVDEYQDTNHMQYLLTSLLSGGHNNICVVGDDDQSIYRFRGATIENILNFEHEYRGSRLIRLEQNYRSTQTILNAANAVIANNIGRKGKHLWTENPKGDPITIYEANDEGGEANYISGQILKKSAGKNFSDFAILYRTNAQSNAIEFALKRNAIPYRVIGGMRFFERAEIKDMLSYLCVINNRTDDLRLRRIINNPPRGLGPKALETADRLAAAEGKGLYNVVSNPEYYAPLEKSAAKFRKFSEIIEGLSALLAEGMSLPDFYDEVLIRTGYASMLELKPTEENKTRLENVKELKSSIAGYVQNTENPTLSGFLEEVALYTDIEEYNDSDDAVVLMTMHAAKGLEFPHTFLVGFEDGLFPGMRAIGSAEEMEEERRLCYVAITRAKKSLTISYAKQRMLYGRTNAAMQSRFLREIPEDVTVRKGGYYSVQYVPPTYAQPQIKRVTQPTYLNNSGSKAPTMLNVRKGDMVQHTAFGKGMVLSVIQMGGDALVEIAFDQIGTKKLMLKTASQHMKKL